MSDSSTPFIKPNGYIGIGGAVGGAVIAGTATYWITKSKGKTVAFAALGMLAGLWAATLFYRD